MEKIGARGRDRSPTWLLSVLLAIASGLPGSLPTQATTPTPSQPTQAKPKVGNPIVPISLHGSLGVDELLGGFRQSRQRQALLVAVNRSLRYLQTTKAAEDYRKYRVPGVTRDRVQRSLERFRQLLQTTQSAAALQAAVEKEFELYQAIGKDGQGTVAFTGYFEPVHVASRVQTPEFRYPIFRPPADLTAWSQPHPTRLQLEGVDGLQYSKSRLKGQELVWLHDRLEAFLIQVQGSARLQLTDGSVMTIGYAGNTNYPYTGVGRELVNAGKFTLEELTLPRLIQYFEQNPADLNLYLPRNRRFVFFRDTGGMPATGSLGVPVTAERSIATDKSQFPPGALALIQAQIPDAQGQVQPVTRYVLDQDTGGAIVGPGRVDVFMGTGKQAGDRAGLINSTGHLYYLLLK